MVRDFGSILKVTKVMLIDPMLVAGKHNLNLIMNIDYKWKGKLPWRERSKSNRIRCRWLSLEMTTEITTISKAFSIRRKSNGEAKQCVGDRM